MPHPDEPAKAVFRHKCGVLDIDHLNATLGGNGVALDEERETIQVIDEAQ